MLIVRSTIGTTRGSDIVREVSLNTWRNRIVTKWFIVAPSGIQKRSSRRQALALAVTADILRVGRIYPNQADRGLPLSIGMSPRRKQRFEKSSLYRLFVERAHSVETSESHEPRTY